VTTVSRTGVGVALAHPPAKQVDHAADARTRTSVRIFITAI